MKRKNVYILVSTAHGSGRGNLQGILRYCVKKPEWALHICDATDYGTDTLCQSLKRGVADGVITGEAESPDLVRALTASSVPLVVIGTRKDCLPKRTDRILFVTENEEKLGTTAANHLMRIGTFKTYAFVGLREKHYAYLSALREKSFCQTIRDNRLPAMVYRTTTEPNVSDIDTLGQWLLSLDRPAAVLAGNDKRAAQVIDACDEAGLRIPDDIRVLGIDNEEPFCQLKTPKISSICRYPENEGFAAAKALDEMFRGRSRPAARKTIFCPSPYEIVSRGTTRVLAPGLELVNRAQHYIKVNANRNVTVAEVVRHLGVSQRLLYLRFSEFAGKTVQHAIDEARIACVKQNLASGNRTIRDIALSCGFDHPNRLMAMFRRQTGMTMREWRRTR